VSLISLIGRDIIFHILYIVVGVPDTLLIHFKSENLVYETKPKKRGKHLRWFKLQFFFTDANFKLCMTRVKKNIKYYQV
jgi:hypothetical protein